MSLQQDPFLIDAEVVVTRRIFPGGEKRVMDISQWCHHSPTGHYGIKLEALLLLARDVSGC